MASRKDNWFTSAQVAELILVDHDEYGGDNKSSWYLSCDEDEDCDWMFW